MMKKKLAHQRAKLWTENNFDRNLQKLFKYKEFLLEMLDKHKSNMLSKDPAPEQWQ